MLQEAARTLRLVHAIRIVAQHHRKHLQVLLVDREERHTVNRQHPQQLLVAGRMGAITRNGEGTSVSDTPSLSRCDKDRCSSA